MSRIVALTAILLLITVFLFSACKGEAEKKNAVAQTATQNVARDNFDKVSNKEISNTEIDILGRLPVKHFPIEDSTSFDNFEKSGIADKGFLKQIKFDPRRKDATNFRLNYKIPFSENFTSVVFTYQCGEHELLTTLITINKEYKILDQLVIAYDEVAESAFGKTSKIENGKIVVTSSNWMMSEEPVFESETYILENNGEFKKVHVGAL